MANKKRSGFVSRPATTSRARRARRDHGHAPTRGAAAHGRCGGDGGGALMSFEKGRELERENLSLESNR